MTFLKFSGAIILSYINCIEKAKFIARWVRKVYGSHVESQTTNRDIN
jgi:hypothetical protein